VKQESEEERRRKARKKRRKERRKLKNQKKEIKSKLFEPRKRDLLLQKNMSHKKVRLTDEEKEKQEKEKWREMQEKKRELQKKIDFRKTELKKLMRRFEYRPAERIRSLSAMFISQVACGDKHSLVMTTTGQVRLYYLALTCYDDYRSGEIILSGAYLL
jgi:hypothetical protein